MSATAGTGTVDGPGSSEGAPGAGVTSGGPGIGPARPRARKCFGNPPRQTEDPQSPPCVPYFVGDNGGATYKGVTADEIRIAMPAYDAFMATTLENYFNARYEFYGRQLRLLKGYDTALGAGNPAATMRADATAVDEQMHAFASVIYQDQTGYHYYAELACRHLIGVTMDPLLDEASMAAWHPYYWQYPMANDQELAMEGEWACSRLAGRKAVHAGTPDIQGATRKFGIIWETYSDAAFSPKPLTDKLAACGVTDTPVVQVDVSGNKSGGYSSGAAAAVVRMRSANVTSIFLRVCRVPRISVAGRVGHKQRLLPRVAVRHLHGHGHQRRHSGTFPQRAGGARARHHVQPAGATGRRPPRVLG